VRERREKVRKETQFSSSVVIRNKLIVSMVGGTSLLRLWKGFMNY